jgi:hypothetical protein
MSIPNDKTLKEVRWKDWQEIPDPQVKDAADQYDEARRKHKDRAPAFCILYSIARSWQLSCT